MINTNSTGLNKIEDEQKLTKEDLMDYKHILQTNYNRFIQEEKKRLRQDIPSKFEFLSHDVFGFTTYDGSMDDLFGQKAIEVCKAISKRKTFEYIEDKENYKWYIVMCNMDFFKDKISWGCSIRGAFWAMWVPIGELKGVSFSNLCDDEGNDIKINFNTEKWKEFIEAILEFVKE